MRHTAKQQEMLDLPGFIPPELAAHCRQVGRWLRPLVESQPGLIAAWLPQEALIDRVGSPPTEDSLDPFLLIVALVEPGCEGSVSAGSGGDSVTMTMMDEATLRDALEWDDELVGVVAGGYRVCGREAEAVSVESLAREIAQAVGNRQ